MTAFVSKRLLIGLVTLIIASIVVFAVLEIVPGDPALLMLGMNATPEALASLRGPIDAFFEQVTVNDADTDVRRRRLNLLARFRNAVHGVADFSRIEG